MFELWTRNWRRKKVVGRPVPALWEQELSESLWYWKQLSRIERERLLRLVAIFLDEKEIFVPPAVTRPDAARVLIAGTACLMLLGFNDWYCFDRIKTVVLSARAPVTQIPSGPGPVISEVLASGIYTTGAPVQLCWPDVRFQCSSSESRGNVVIHEFAHHIDDLDGSLAGDPPFPTRALERRWKQIADQERNRLTTERAPAESYIIDPYGHHDPVEFFAVACEAFFCRPVEMETYHPNLFELLVVLFRNDPRRWFSSLKN